MNLFRRKIIALTVVIFCVGFQISFVTAIPSLTVFTDKSEYQYGDRLSIVIEVSEITGKSLILQIRDESGTKSTPITLPISNATTKITAREPFDSTIYKPGLYYLDVEYSGDRKSVV